jgi:hypothetical protein
VYPIAAGILALELRACSLLFVGMHDLSLASAFRRLAVQELSDHLFQHDG